MSKAEFLTLTISRQHAPGRGVLCGFASERLRHRQHLFDGSWVCYTILCPADVQAYARLGLDLLRGMYALCVYRHLSDVPGDQRSGSACLLRGRMLIRLGITLEEVEAVFGTGAGQRVKAVLGKSSAIDPRTP